MERPNEDLDGALPCTRRGFLSGTGRAALAAALAAPAGSVHRPASGLAPPGPVGPQGPGAVLGKDGLRILNDRPINAETPAHLLDDDVTPAPRLFVRNNGHPPPADAIDPATWELEIAGEAVLRPAKFRLAELKARFEPVTLRLLIECAGNGRAEFDPPAAGNPWTTGAVGCPEWTGVRLRDLLEHCGLAPNAVYVGYEGADLHLSGAPGKLPISRGVPMRKALEAETLLAFAMNGADIPWLHGHPLRLVCGGWPASTSGKWLRRLLVRDRVHDGEKMGGSSYRVPKHPVQPGSAVPDEDMVIIESMPVKSLLTFPRSGIVHPFGAPLAVRGQAWAGDLAVAEVWTSIDHGGTWQRARLDPPPNRLAWQRWRAELEFPAPGYYEVWARAVDTEGRSQPMLVPGWNPKGYLNNACHRIAVQVQA
jgi:DMSO/TMAO reductase YedYZ molybdopterin-dependent catalytic subunit